MKPGRRFPPRFRLRNPITNGNETPRRAPSGSGALREERRRALVVEDERLLADAIAEWLRDDTHAVDLAYDGAAALERVGVNDYDVVVLDRDLPLVHGDEVCRELVRGDTTARVLMLTAAAEITDRVDG